MARGGRRGGKKSTEPIEPFHTLRVTLEETERELDNLCEARVVRVRTRLTTDLGRLDAAGTAMRLARHLFQPKAAELTGWDTIIDLLDRLECTDDDPSAILAEMSLKLLADTGYALDFERCVRCGRPCPADRSAYLNVSDGGLVCHACGGAGEIIDARLRRCVTAFQRGEKSILSEPPRKSDITAILRLISTVMTTHAGARTST